MIILPAIDIKDGQCVRLVKGDYGTASQMAESPLAAAESFSAAGAQWLHMVDLDGAKDKRPVNHQTVLDVVRQYSGMKVEVGGGIREMSAVELYLENGVERVILGSAALENKQLLVDAIKAYGDRIAVGIDARDGMVAANGWLATSQVNYLDLAREMEQLGVRTIIFTDISRDGTLTEPNYEQLSLINGAVSCDIIASGGISSTEAVRKLKDDFLYGAICGKAIYTGALSLDDALSIADSQPDLDRFFAKGELIPTVVQSAEDGTVLMLAYMNKESLGRTIDSGYTWFYSRSRQELWNKGETSGHLQKVVSMHYDCDMDTLLVKVVQSGAACHTGNYSCFYRRIKP